jgi:probable HAF family extracellular repeat protein
MAVDVNDAGQVVGGLRTPSGTHAFSWTLDGGLVDLGTLGGASSNALAVNEHGWIVGTSSTASGVDHAVLWRDVTAPVAPSTPSLEAATDSGPSSTDGVTNHTALVLVGTAEPGSTVTLLRHGAAVGTARARSGAGAWAIATTVGGDGTYVFTATAADVAGNVSTTSPALTVRADTVAPVLNVSGAASGTSFTLPSLPVRPSFAPADAGSGLASSEDTWTTPGTSNGAGAYVYSATATDRAGNTSTEVRRYEVVDPNAGAGGGGGGGDAAPAPVPAAVPVETAVPTPPPAAPFAAPRPTVRPVVARPATVPRRLLAAKAAVVSFEVTRSDTGRKLTSGQMACDPTVAGRVIRHREQFADGLATLRFTVPKTAKGKLLKVRLTIRLGAESATRVTSFRIP